MHDTDTVAPLKQPATTEDNAILMRPTASAMPQGGAAAQDAPRGLLGRLLGFLARLFTRRRPAKTFTPDPVVADRAAAAIAAHMEPPMAFRGDTTNTLASPMGAYAGKPAMQAMRKRAEQQFKNMDTTTATMN